jgi:hypothetical protein
MVIKKVVAWIKVYLLVVESEVPVDSHFHELDVVGLLTPDLNIS